MYKEFGAMREYKVKANRARFTVVGPGRAGKTCVARSFLNMAFEDTSSIQQGIDDLGLRATVHQAKAREGRWEEFREFEKMYEGYLAQYIHDKRRCLKTRDEAASKEPTNGGVTGFWSRVLIFLQKMRRNITDSKPSPPSTLVDDAFVQKILGEYGDKTTGLVVSILDFGGSEVIDAIQPFFLGPNGVYAVVFNMEQMMSKSEGSSYLEEIRAWVNALIINTATPDYDDRLKCASIALVGTHKDRVPDAETHRDISNTLETLLGRNSVWRSLLENESESLCFFPVDCSKGLADPNMVNLKKAIETDILQSDYVNVERPLRYFEVLDEMNERKKTVSYLSYDEVSEIANKCSFGAQDVLEDMLRFFHELGLIMWHEGESMGDKVFLDPLRLFFTPVVNILSQMRNDTAGVLYGNEKVLGQSKEEGFSDSMTLTKKGIVTDKQLDRILKEHVGYEAKRRDAMQKIMINYGLMVPVDSTTNSSAYIVPSLVRRYIARSATDLSVDGNTVYFCFSLDFQFKEFYTSFSDVKNKGLLIPNVFPCFIAHLVREKRIDIKISGYSDQVEFCFDDAIFEATEILSWNCICVVCKKKGKNSKGHIEKIEEMLAKVAKERVNGHEKSIQVYTMIPFAAKKGTKEEKYLIRLDRLRGQKHNFEICDSVFDIVENEKNHIVFTE